VRLTNEHRRCYCNPNTTDDYPQAEHEEEAAQAAAEARVVEASAVGRVRAEGEVEVELTAQSAREREVAALDAVEQSFGRELRRARRGFKRAQALAMASQTAAVTSQEARSARVFLLLSEVQYIKRVCIYLCIYLYRVGISYCATL